MRPRIAAAAAFEGRAPMHRDRQRARCSVSSRHTRSAARRAAPARPRHATFSRAARAPRATELFVCALAWAFGTRAPCCCSPRQHCPISLAPLSHTHRVFRKHDKLLAASVVTCHGADPAAALQRTVRLSTTLCSQLAFRISFRCRARSRTAQRHAGARALACWIVRFALRRGRAACTVCARWALRKVPR